MALKLTKEKVLDAMDEVIEHDAKLVNAFKGLRMNKDAKVSNILGDNVHSLSDS